MVPQRWFGPGRVRMLIVPWLTLALVVAGLPARADAAPVFPDAPPATTLRQFRTSQRVVALTFDTDGSRGYTAQILDTLAAWGVHASFGLTGSFASGNADLVRRMANEGQQIFNHSWDHPYFTRISSAERARQLDRTADLVRQETGVEVAPYFRPPFGAYDSSVLADLAVNGYAYNVMWSVDPQGWRGKSGGEITRLVLQGATPGAIVLMHTMTAGDAAALPAVIDELRARGYGFATVREFVGGAPAPAPPPPESRFFPETGFWVAHGFLRYWERFGGLQAFGYPLSDEVVEGGLTVQYFERARFEWHPGAWPSHFDVLLGHLGVESARRDNLLTTAPFLPVTNPGDATCTLYPETGHHLCSGFRAWWQAHGGLEILGYPISQEFIRNGVTVQYFERQRLEYHPENAPPWDIEGGLLGVEVLTSRP